MSASDTSPPEPPARPEPPAPAEMGDAEREPAYEPPAPSPRGPVGPSQGGRPRWPLAAALLAGALAGALVAGSISLATDDDGGDSESAIPAHSSAAIDNLDVAAVLRRVEPAVVSIRTETLAASNLGTPEAEEAAGTGFVVTEDGKILTNNHVIAGAQQIQVTFSDGSAESGRVLGTDPGGDLAVVQVDANNLPTAELGDSSSVHVGDPVVAVGNALALPGGPTVTDGIVSALDRTITEEDDARLQHMIQTDAAINPGNSGGPLADSQGRVIGINTATDRQGQNIGFAISADQASNVLGDLEGGQTPARPFLGLQAEDVTPAVERQVGLSVDRGALVVGVVDGSPAANAGIREGDVILKVGSHDVRSTDDLDSAVSDSQPGDRADVVVQRGTQRTTVTVEVGQQPASGG